MRLLRFLSVFLFSLAWVSSGLADSCKSPRNFGAEIVLKTTQSLQEPISLLVRGKSSCSNKFLLSHKKSKHTVKLKKGSYTFLFSSPSCTSKKKKVLIKNRISKIKISLTCTKTHFQTEASLTAYNAAHTIFPEYESEISLPFQSTSPEVVSYVITRNPAQVSLSASHGTSIRIHNLRREPVDDSFSFKMIQSGHESNEATISLRTPQNFNDVIDGIIAERISTSEEVTRMIQVLTFDEVFQSLEEKTLSSLLQTIGAISAHDSIGSLLNERGIQGASLKLNPAGLISGIASLLGPQRVQYVGASNPFSELLIAPAAYEKLQRLFEADKISFLNFLSPHEIRSLMLSPLSKEVSQDRIRLITSETVPALLPSTQSDIIRRFAIQLKFETGEKSDSWNIPTLVTQLRKVAPEHRTIFVTFGAGNGVAALDPLKDANGNIIEKFPGIPYRFPSYGAWEDRLAQNLRTYLLNIKNEFLLQHEHPAIGSVVVDFESIRNDWLSTVLYFQGAHDKLLLDPRTASLLSTLMISDEDIRSMNAWNAADPKALRWDAYMLQQRAAALSRGIGDTIREVFEDQNIVISNYDDTLRSDIVPNGAFAQKEFRIWGSLGTSLRNYAPSIPLYGLQYQRLSTPEGEILSIPPAPSVIHQVSDTEFYTRNNTFVSTLNRINSVSIATDLPTNHFVTFKEFLDTWHSGYYGPCVRYLPDPNVGGEYRYQKTECDDSEGIGDFMYEYWALAAQNSRSLNLYTLGANRLPITDVQAIRASSTIQDLNRLIGYSDREIPNDAVVYINGVRMAVTPQKVPYGKPFYLWAVRANNKIVYRVVFMAPNGFDKRLTVIRDGSHGDGVLITYGGAYLEIPKGTIDAENFQSTLSPYGLFVTQPFGIGKLDSH